MQASEPLVLWVTQQASVIKLHQGIRDERIMPSVEPRNFVEKRTGCTRDDVTLELHLVSLLGNQRLLSLIQTKVIGWRMRVGRERKTRTQIIFSLKPLTLLYIHDKISKKQSKSSEAASSQNY